MRLLLILALITQSAAIPALANEHAIDVLGIEKTGLLVDPLPKRPAKRFQFGTKFVEKVSDWQTEKITVTLYEKDDNRALPARAYYPRITRLIDFSITGKTHSEVEKALNMHSEAAHVKSEVTEDYCVSFSGGCGASGNRWLQLKFVDNKVSAYRFYSSGLI